MFDAFMIHCKCQTTMTLAGDARTRLRLVTSLNPPMTFTRRLPSNCSSCMQKECMPGLENGFEKTKFFLGYLKNLKSPKFWFFNVFKNFWSNFIQIILNFKF